MGTHKITFTFLVGKLSKKNVVVLPVGLKYKVTTSDSLKNERKATASSETSARINLTTKLHFQKNLVIDVDLL